MKEKKNIPSIVSPHLSYLPSYYKEDDHNGDSLVSLITAWNHLPPSERKNFFRTLQRTDAEELFLLLKSEDQKDLLSEISLLEKRSWLKLLAPDDAADLIQLFEEDERDAVINLFDTPTRIEIGALLKYADDMAGGLMNPRFVRLRPDMLVDEAIHYLRLQAKTHVETIYNAYVIDQHQILCGVVSFREVFCAPPEKSIRDIMITDLITVREDLDQEDVGRLFSQHDLMAIPVVDEEGKMKGIVTLDDIVSVVEEEATEDIQKIGGMEALDAPYFQTNIWENIKKRAGWLLIFFLGEMLTASTMGHYSHELQQALVLALFIPLIMSAGGNCGSQASTLIVRAMALREVKLSDWWRVCRREVMAGFSLGFILAVMGFIRIYFWPNAHVLYGPYYFNVAVSVAISLICIVLWGTLCGAMLPFGLRRFGLDPATASAPFVATMVDVTGLMVYFTVARIVLQGSLL